MGSFCVVPDLSKRKLEVMQYALSRMFNKDSSIKQKQLIDYIYLDAKCNIVAVTSTGLYIRFHTEDEFDLLLETQLNKSKMQ